MEETSKLMRLVDQLLNCDGEMSQAFEAGHAITLAAISRAVSSGGLSSDPWELLLDEARQAKADGDKASVAKIALACFLWNHMIVPEDHDMMRALGRATERLQTQIYAVGLGCLLQLDPSQRLGGGRRGQFLVEDARVHVSTGIVLMRDLGIPVRREVYDAALPWIIEAQ